uniref:Nuclear receptor coactivator 7-like n=1 Tax=Esox lucius TaxID=8010 RepID=A0A6Q2ZJ31_ESOLU
MQHQDTSLMEKRERKPGYFARLKRRRQLKQSQSEKTITEQNNSDSSLKTPVISCPDIPAFSDPQERIKPNPPGDLDDSSNMSSQAKREKRRPPGTVEYTVGPQESLNSIALKFNITPNKLVQLNRLFSRSVYPGQKLFVPDFQSGDSSGPILCSSMLPGDVLQDGNPCSRAVKPFQRELSPLSEDESPATVKFIKMSCKYFTDGMGVVGGVMIVTPNNIMFDPHKSDPLVIEHGCEEYGLICPMEEVVSVALYDDISRMKLKDALPSDLPQDLCPLYRPGEWEELPSEHDLNPFSRYEALDPKRPIVLDDMDSALSETESEVDQNRKLSLSETADSLGKSCVQECSLAGGPQIGPMVEEGLSEEEKQKNSNKAEVKSWLLEKMQAPIQNMLISMEEKSKTPPMFLCFKVGKPMRKSFVIGRTSSPANTRGKQPEYWFAVPQERLEIITIDEAKRRQSFGSYDGEEPLGDLLPMLSDPSALLQDTHIEKLACRLPARVQGYPWRLAYSTLEHGTSLKTMYRSLLEVDSPVLLVIKDMGNQLFGGYSTHPFRVSEHCYGTGETFLFSFCPEIKVYRWTGKNSYFVKGNIDSLQMGGGGGQIGLWLDADLYHGTTSSCATFHNQPLTTQDFTIQSVEVWAFE